VTSAGILVAAVGLAVTVLAVDQAAKVRLAAALGGRRAGPLASSRSLHVPHRGVRTLWRDHRIASAVWLAALLGTAAAWRLLGEAGTLPFLALATALGGAASNLTDLRRHGGIVNCATWSGRVSFNVADVAIVSGAVAASLSAAASLVRVPGP
jgi:lipoprotein signal peptidase